MRKRLLARPEIFLHVGAMKTGTTYLQSVLDHNRERLADEGLLIPPDNLADNTRAVRDVLGMTGNDPQLAERVSGLWDVMVKRMRDWDGRSSLYSMEFLSFADAKKAKRVVSTLGRAKVHVILTVRDTTGAIPAQWQTYTRNRGSASWPDFVTGVREFEQGSTDSPASTFRRAQNIPRMLRAWSAAVPASRFHVVTVPPSGAPPSLLWERLASVVGVNPGVAQLDQVLSNPSLGYGSSDMCRRVNPALKDLRLGPYQNTMRHLGDSVLSGRRGEESRARLDEGTARFAADWNARVREAIEAHGVHVVGDLDDLPTSPPTEGLDPGDRPRDVSPDEVLAAAAAAAAGLRSLAESQGATVPAPVWDHETPDVDAAVAEVASLFRAATPS